MASMVRCIGSFTTGRRIVRAKDVLPAGDPIVKQYPTRFVPLEGSAPARKRKAKAKAKAEVAIDPEVAEAAADYGFDAEVAEL